MPAPPESPSGTSSASPHVAGAVARYLELFPTAEPALVAANADFAVDLYRRLAAKPGNVFISPISLAGVFGPVVVNASAAATRIRSRMRCASARRTREAPVDLAATVVLLTSEFNALPGTVMASISERRTSQLCRSVK